MGWTRRRGVALLLSVAMPLASVPLSTRAAADPSAADLETARALYKQGRDLRDKGDLPGALDKLKAANALAGTPITGLELGRTHLMMGHLVEARQAFLDVGRIPVKGNESATAKAARLEADKLAADVKPRIPDLLVTVKGVPDGKTPTVTIDGATILPETLAVPHKLDPGSHVVTARVGTGKEQTLKVDLEEGQSKTIEIVVPEEAIVPVVPLPPPPTTSKLPDTPPPKRDEPRAASNYTLSYIGFGVAGAGAIVGSITGFLAINKTSDLEDQCPNKQCPVTLGSDIDSTKTLGNVSTISFAVAGAGAIVGVIGLLVSGGGAPAAKDTGAARPSVSVFLGPSTAGLQGAF